MLKQDKEGYYIVDSALSLKQYHKMTDMTMREKIQLRAELNAEKGSIEKPKKTKKKITKKADRPEPTAFDKWFN